MWYYWLWDRMTQQQFNIFWDKGVNNDADYYTKHHATVEHRAKRARYIRDKINLLLSTLSSHFSLNSSQTTPREGVLLRT